MKQFLVLLFICISTMVIAQSDYSDQEVIEEERIALTIGILQGGGSLVGADLEYLVTEQIGIQAGAGLVGFGAGVNYHFKPSIRSSFISLSYWNQGFGDNFTQSAIGPTYVFRGEKWFTFQIGIGAVTNRSQATIDALGGDPPVMLLYSIGGYIPL